MDRLTTLTMPDYGISPNGIRSFTVDSVIRGRGPDRLKYLDLEGRWKLNGQSVMCISSAFKHLERLNDAKDPFRLFSDEPLNAIGLVGWKGSEETPKPKEEEKPLLVIEPEKRVARFEVPASPREPVPHRSAGYDIYAAPEERKSESKGDLGYASAEERYGSKSPYTERPPHRTQTLSPRIETAHRKYDSEFNPYSLFNQDRRYGDELMVSVKETTRQPPFRSGGYGDPHLTRQYDISPRSLPSDYSSASEQGSPYSRNVDDVLVTTYHMTKTTRREQQTPHRTPIY